MEADQWFLLMKLAELGAFRKPIFSSTTTLATELKCSQQTVSRWLKELAGQGYIERKISLRGEYIILSRLGEDELIRVHTTLTSLFKPRETPYIQINGKLFTGLGEGAYYVTREGYKRQFIRKLGFKPYPGTLNLKLTEPAQTAARKELETLPGIIIEGFGNGARTYGMIKCIPAIINEKVKGAVLLIQRTHHNTSVLELIGPVNLRNALKINDDDIVNVRISV